jgi:hypothetical protein
MNVLRKKLETTGLKIERCVVDFMLLPIEKGKVYCPKVEPDVLFRYGDTKHLPTKKEWLF